jgi:hypothetical protein
MNDWFAEEPWRCIASRSPIDCSQSCKASQPSRSRFRADRRLTAVGRAV